MNHRKLIVGAVFWTTAVIGGWTILKSELSTQSSTVSALSRDVTQWLSGQKQRLKVSSAEPMSISIGDPIFCQDATGQWKQVGLAVKATDPVLPASPAMRSVEVEIYNSAISLFDDGFRLEYHTTPTSLDWVVKTMIPPERQKEIAAFITKEWLVHQQELTANLRPVLKAGIRKALKAIERELPEILKAHQDEFRLLGDRYEDEILKAEIVPLVKEEIFPIIEEEAVPVAEEVGRALWQRVSLWSFAWRFAYDKSPLPKRDAVKKEFRRFVDDEALPELRTRSQQFIEVTEAIVRRSMKNPRVREVMKRNFKLIAEDSELHQVVGSVIRDAVVTNDTLRMEIERYLKEQETRAALKLAGARMEPTVRHIGDMIFGNREQGITPEFSRILRSQILTKDRRWFVMVRTFDTTSRSGSVPASWADQPMLYPMGFGGQAQSPLTPSE